MNYRILSIFILCTTVVSFVTPNRVVVNGTGASVVRSTFRFPQKPRVINQIYENGGTNNNGINQHYTPQNGIQNGGVIECICPCTKEYLPVCGITGQIVRTFANNCLFQCQRGCTPGLRFKSCGRCEEPTENTKLPCL